jgi:lysophospholipase L1-like esterase
VSPYSYFFHPHYCFRDAAKTAHCNVGDPIYWLTERFGSGLDCSQPTLAYRPILMRAPTGQYYGVFNGAKQHMPIPSGLSVNTQSLSSWINYVSIGTQQLQVPLRIGGANTWNIYSQQTNVAADAATLKANNTPNTTAVINRAQANTVAQIGSASGSSTRVNGVKTSGSAPGSSALTGGLIGIDNVSTYLYAASMAVAEVLVYPNSQNDTVAAQVESYFTAQGIGSYPYPTNAPIIVCDGASSTQGRTLSDAGSGLNYDAFPQVVAASLANPAIVVNLGVSGMPTATMTSSATSRTDPHYNLSRSKNVLVGWEIVNDILNNDAGGAGSYGSTAYANIKAYYQARRTAGWPFIVAIDCDLATGFSGGQTTDANNCNSLLAADFPNATAFNYVFTPSSPTYADVLIKASAMSLTFTDGFHMNAASYATIATAILNALSLAGVS